MKKKNKNQYIFSCGGCWKATYLLWFLTDRRHFIETYFVKNHNFGFRIIKVI